MPRKILRQSSLTPKNRTLPSDPFLFEVEPLDGTFSIKGKGGKSAKKTRSKNVISKGSREISTSTKKLGYSVVALAPGTNSTSEASESAGEERIMKKIVRKKKHRGTQKLNNFEKGDTYPQTEINAKPKKTKKARGRSFLPPIDIIEDQKLPKNSTTDSDDKENETGVQHDMKCRRGRSRRIRKTPSAQRLSEELDKCTDGSDSVFFTDPDNKKDHTDTDAREEKNPVVQDNTVDTSLFARCSSNSPTVKRSVNGRKSSFEVSFKTNKRRSSNKILENLNITTRDSSKSSSKKSSTGFKRSSGSENENTKNNYITIRKPYHTLAEFNFDSSGDEFTTERKSSLRKYKNFEQLVHTSNEPVSLFDAQHSSEFPRSPDIPIVVSGASPTSKTRKSILKKPLARNRDTYELVEHFCEALESNDELPFVLGTPTVTKETSPRQVGSLDHRNIIDVSSAELGYLMLGSGDYVLLGSSFINETKTIAPGLVRENTFTKTEELTPQPHLWKNTFVQKEELLDSPQNENRKSIRKRWSQVEPLPIFGMTPSAKFSTTAPNSGKFSSTLLQCALTPHKPKKELRRKKSVKIENSQTNITNVTLTTEPFYESPLKSANLQLTTTEKPSKGKKCVKIESPLTTPKTMPHTPMVIRKTPKPSRKLPNDSFLTGNCAFPKFPAAASTPFYNKSSLLKKVLTNEKSKAEKSVKAPTSRVKMPDFREIHRRQFEKMENIKDMQERKAVRAQYLISGTKPVASTSGTRNVEKESKKKLIFGSSKDLSKKTSKPVQHMLKKRASLEKKKKELKSKVPVLVPPSRLAEDKPKTPQKPALKPKKPVVNRLSPQKKATAEIKDRIKLGFRPTKATNISREGQIKAVATKSKVAVNRTDQNRQQIAHYRSNRRFELLMQMRAQQK